MRETGNLASFPGLYGSPVTLWARPVPRGAA